MTQNEKEVYSLEFIGRMVESLRDEVGSIIACFDKIDTRLDQIEEKVDKLGIQIIGIRGLVSDIESGVQSIANVLDRSGLLSV